MARLPFLFLLIFFGLFAFHCKSQNIQKQSQNKFALFLNGCAPNDARAVRVFLLDKAINCKDHYSALRRIGTYLEISNTKNIQSGRNLKPFGYSRANKNTHYGAMACSANTYDCQDLGALHILPTKVSAGQIEANYYIEKNGKRIQQGQLQGRLCHYTPRYCG